MPRDRKYFPLHSQKDEVDAIGGYPTPALSAVIRSVLTISLAQSAADGVINSLEISAIKRRIRDLYYLDDCVLDRLCREAVEGAAEVGDSALLNALAHIRRVFSPDQKNRTLHLLLEFAEHDNVLTPSEISFIHRVKEEIVQT